MILYHGSNVLFKEFLINKELLRTELLNLSEGMGIYLAKDREMSKSYGMFTYHVEVRKVLDLTNVDKVTMLVDKLLNIKNISRFISADMKNILIGSILMGYQSIHRLDSEIYNLLDSNEKFYNSCLNISMLRHELWATIDNMFDSAVIKFHLRDLGDIFICKNVQLLKIKRVDFNV